MLTSLRWLTAYLQIRPGEGLMAARVTGLMFFASVGGGIGAPGVEALFYARFGVQFLPYLYIALGLLTLVTSLLMSGLLGRVSRGQLYGHLPLAMALLLLVERFLLMFDLGWFYPLLWLGMNVFWVLQIQLSWGLAGMVCDTRQAKRLFPLFGAGGILGLAVGGLVTRPLVSWIGTENLLLGWAAGLGIAFALSRSLINQYRGRDRRRQRRRGRLLDEILQGYQFTRRSALMRWMSLAAVLFAVLWFLIVFPFARAAAAQFPDEDTLAGFLGVLQGISTGTAILVSLLLANRLYARFGFMASILIYPLIYLAGFSILAVRAAFPALVAFRFAQLVWSEGVAQGANQAIYNVVPPEQREQTRAFVRGVANQAGVSLAGVILVASEQVLQPAHLYWIGSAAAALTVYLVWQARRSYVLAVTDALRAGHPQLFFDEEQPFGGFKQDADAVTVVVAGIYSPEPAIRRVSAEILGQIPAPELVPALAGALQDPDASVRAALVRAIARAGVPASGPELAVCLQDPEPEVRIETVEAVRQQAGGPDGLELLQPLLSDPDPAVRSRAVAALLNSNFHLQAMQVLRGMVRSELESQVEGLKALVEWGSQEAYDLAAEALESPEALVRRQAAEILARIDARQCIYPLINVLGDKNLSVREAAARALGGVGLPALEPVMAALSDPDLEDGALLALEHLPVQRAAGSLRAYAQNRAGQVQVYHRLWLEGRSFDDRDGPLRLAVASLRDKSLLDAQRSLRAVGLLWDRRSISLAMENLQSRDPEQRANALEMLESSGEAEVVRPLLGLWDSPGSVPPGRLVDWLARLLQDPDPWLRACAALAAKEMEDPRLASFLDHLAGSDPDEGVRESARLALYGGNAMKTLPTLSLMERVLFLRQVPLFADLSPTDLKQIAVVTGEHFFSPGEKITVQGEMADEMFIIVSGEVSVVMVAEDGMEKEIARRKPGDVVGEMAMISQEPRMASLVALGEVRMLCIDQSQFEGIMRLRPETSLAVMRVLCQRLRECSQG